MSIFGVSGASWLGAVGTGVTLLGALTWVGGALWQLGVWHVGINMPAFPAVDGDHFAQARHDAVKRFTRMSWWLPSLALVGNALVLLAGASQTEASLGNGARIMLTQGSYGTCWLLCQGAALGALLVLVLMPVPDLPDSTTAGAEKMTTLLRTPLAATPAGGVLAAPATTTTGERVLLLRNSMLLASGVLFLGALSLADHAAPTLGVLALPFDYLRLVAASVWLGGIFTLALTVLPGVRGLSPRAGADLIVALRPVLAPVALVAIVTLVLASGVTVAATITPSQLTTTNYGRVLLLELALVVVMVALSLWQLAGLPARLVVTLRRQATISQAPSPVQLQALADEIAAQVGALVTRFVAVTRWLAALGVGVIICVALLSVLAGSLSPAVGNAGGQTLVLRQPVGGGVTATLTLPATHIGTSATVVALQAAGGTPVRDATIVAHYAMLDMPMGTQTATLSYRAATQDYAGSLDLLMAGRWQIDLTISTPGQGQRHAIFTIVAQQ